MTNYTNKTLLRDRKRWRIERIDELDDGELGEQKCTKKVGILPGPTKKWRIKRIDKLNDNELNEFNCTWKSLQFFIIIIMTASLMRVS